MKCAIKSANTNEGRCRFDWGLFQRIILIPVNEEFTGEDFDSWLMEGIHAANPEDRFYPMPQFTGAEDKSEDNTTSTNGYGKTYVVREGSKGVTQTYNPNYCLSNRLAAFNDGIARGALILDSRGNVWGCAGQKGGMKGFTTEVFCSTARPTPADSIQEPSIDYTFVKPEEFSQKMVQETDWTVSDIQGLEDVEIQDPVVSGNNTTFKIFTVCDGKDVTSEMRGIAGSSNDDAWKWFDEDGNPVTGTTPAPTYNSTSNVFEFVTANLPQGAKKITLADPSVLYSKDVTYKECKNKAPLS